MKRFFHAGGTLAKKSSSQLRWLDRQTSDSFTRQAKAEDYRSRAAFKLLEIDSRFRIFRPGQTVVDLGFAPGSWSQVAVRRTRPNGRVIGVDMLQVQPPPGVIAVQGNFLSVAVQDEVKKLVRNRRIGTPRSLSVVMPQTITDTLEDFEKDIDEADKHESSAPRGRKGMADVILSDMYAPWPQTSGFWTNVANYPYFRLQNVSGLIARDHAYSMVSYQLHSGSNWH